MVIHSCNPCTWEDHPQLHREFKTLSQQQQQKYKGYPQNLWKCLDILHVIISVSLGLGICEESWNQLPMNIILKGSFSCIVSFSPLVPGDEMLYFCFSFRGTEDEQNCVTLSVLFVQCLDLELEALGSEFLSSQGTTLFVILSKLCFQYNICTAYTLAIILNNRYSESESSLHDPKTGVIRQGFIQIRVQTSKESLNSLTIQ